MNSIDKYLARILKKREDSIRYHRGIIATDNHSSTRDYKRLLKQLYTNKLDNLEEMDKLLETYLPRWIMKKQTIWTYQLLVRWLFFWEIFDYWFRLRLDSFTGKVCKTFKEEIMLILLKLFQNIKEEGTLPNSFYKAKTIWEPKPKPRTNQSRYQNLMRTTKRKENYRQIMLRNIVAKILNKTWAKQLSWTLLKGSSTVLKYDLILGDVRMAVCVCAC